MYRRRERLASDLAAGHHDSLESSHLVESAIGAAPGVGFHADGVSGVRNNDRGRVAPFRRRVPCPVSVLARFVSPIIGSPRRSRRLRASERPRREAVRRTPRATPTSELRSDLSRFRGSQHSGLHWSFRSVRRSKSHLLIELCEARRSASRRLWRRVANRSRSVTSSERDDWRIAARNLLSAWPVRSNYRLIDSDEPYFFRPRSFERGRPDHGSVMY